MKKDKIIENISENDLTSIRNDIIIQEGDYITEIFFVKRGVISLNISFNFA